MTLPLILGCAGLAPSAAERRFFAAADPLGFILFRRNCETPDQLRALVAGLRDAVGRHAPVLIDQEGGRVARLRPPHWPALPAAGRIGALPGGEAVAAARLQGLAIGAMAAAAGIDMVAAPVLDLDLPGADRTVVGDRSYGAEPERVAALARAMAEGLLTCGVLPVIKHMPGHGRSRVDSHFRLPVIDASVETLAATDFVPFRLLADLPVAMTGHLVFPAIDPALPATLSPAIISGVVRGTIGFSGLLLSDDLSMRALSGPIARRAAAALEAGCDIALHCNGRLGEMRRIADAVPPIGAAAAARFAAARAVQGAAAGQVPPLETLIAGLDRAVGPA